MARWSLATRNETRARLILLLICALGSALIYLVAFALPYPIDSGVRRPLQHFGTLSGPSLGATIQFLGALALLFALYLAGVRLCEGLQASAATFLCVFGGGGLSGVVLLWTYPIFSLDIFYYMAADRIWTVVGENPFVVPPLHAPNDPFFPYVWWGHYVLPYGPLWPWLGALAGSLGRGEIGPTLLGFKTLAFAGYLACVPLIAWASRGLSQNRWLMGSCIFAWNPLVLLELVGGGHNDAIALVPAALALALWIRGSSALAATTLAVSILVKLTAIVLLPALLYESALRAARLRKLRPWVGLHLLPATGLALAAWIPFWQPEALLSQMQEGGQYYQSVTSVVAAVFPPSSNRAPVVIAQVVLVAAFTAFYLRNLPRLAERGRPALRAMWSLSVFYFLVVAPFYSSWYIVWPILLAGALAERRVTYLTTFLCVGGFAAYWVQFVARPTFALDWALGSALGLIAATTPFLIGSMAMVLLQRNAIPGSRLRRTSLGAVST